MKKTTIKKILLGIPICVAILIGSELKAQLGCNILINGHFDDYQCPADPAHNFGPFSIGSPGYHVDNSYTNPAAPWHATYTTPYEFSPGFDGRPAIFVVPASCVTPGIQAYPQNSSGTDITPHPFPASNEKAIFLKDNYYNEGTLIYQALDCNLIPGREYTLSFVATSTVTPTTNL